uniref:Uncharacterized protein n=1 Tax=Meloidogyne incognita TaxID=6306 RepID=A0A914NTU4_MELIC
MKWLMLSRTDMGMCRTRPESQRKMKKKEKELKESKEKLKHARSIDKYGEPIPPEQPINEEEDVADE